MDSVKLAIATLAGFTALACSAETPPVSEADPLEGRAQGATVPSLHGGWRIVQVNGTPTRSYGNGGVEHATVSFGPGGYGGHSGCNSFGGHGLAIDDRWFAQSPMATQQGCTDLAAQEDGIFSILAGGPTVSWQGRDAAELRTADGRLRIERTGPPAQDVSTNGPPMLLAGTRWELQVLDGSPVNPSVAPVPVRLGFEADSWTLETPCGSRTGAWRQVEGAVVLQAGSAEARPCPTYQAKKVEALDRTLVGELRYVVGFNGEFVLANSEHWATGQRDRRLGAETPDLLSGRWRITSVDGGQAPLPGERPPELAFGGGYFGVWDGCRHSEGVAIVRDRQLFTHGSGVVTMANCPQDSIRTKINAVVTSSPRIARATGGALVLTSRAGALRLERTSSQPFGVGVQTRLRSGMAFDLPAGPGRTARLTLGPGDRFTLALSCTTLKGRWRSDRAPWGPYARFGPDGAPPDCADSPDEEPLYGFFMGDVQTAIGPNQDIALFVSNGQSRPARVAAH